MNSFTNTSADPEPFLHIGLLEPEIPQNTGNIARTCVALGCRLHLIGQLGFSLDDRYLKRAGLDYWFDLDLQLWDDPETALAAFAGKPIFYASTKAKRNYADVSYEPGSLILFGCETKGLPEPLLAAHPERAVRIPMVRSARSLNLSNSAAIVAYEASRQMGFPGMDGDGNRY